MQHVQTTIVDTVATVRLTRGKVNALNEATLDALHEGLRTLEHHETVRAIVLTGSGSFFSFGFDVPELFAYPKEAFRRYLAKFTSLYADLYLFQKPVVAALNGHAIAGGCMIAIACDQRTMVSGKGRISWISLNEISFGSTVFAGCVEILKGVVGQRNAEQMVLGGAMYSAEEALGLGLVDQVCAPEDLAAQAEAVARTYGERDGTAFASLKRLVRKPVAEEMKATEGRSIEEFLDLWYSKTTREQLRRITIRP